MALQEQRPGEPAVLGEFVRRIRAVCPAENIVLFGSRAEGGARDDSDYDLLVVLPDHCDPKATLAAIQESLTGLGVAKDLVLAPASRFRRYRDVVNTVYRHANSAGRTLYERAA